jgi:hypothetical protein
MKIPAPSLIQHALLSLLLLPSLPLAAAELHPIVEVGSGYLLGAVKDGKFIKHEDAAKVLKGGEKYRVYSLTTRLGEAKGGKPESAGEACPDVKAVKLSPLREDGVLAIAGQWNALPRVPKSLSTTQPVYVEAVRAFLEERGIKKPAVKITQVLKVDLDGDGEDEVLISGTNYFTKERIPMRSPAGSYSFVLLRQVVSGVVQIKLIEGEFHPKAYSGAEENFDAPASYKVSAVLDVDGDGKMEVIVEGAYYEGGWTTVYRASAKKVEALLRVECGL